jgi:hypothetical protein
LIDLDWEDRERVLRLLFSKMNSGQATLSWRIHEGTSRGEMGRTTGYGSTKANALNQSFREEGEEEDQEDGEENGDLGLAMVEEGGEGNMFSHERSLESGQ